MRANRHSPVLYHMNVISRQTHPEMQSSKDHNEQLHSDTESKVDSKPIIRSSKDLICVRDKFETKRRKEKEAETLAGTLSALTSEISSMRDDIENLRLLVMIQRETFSQSHHFKHNANDSCEALSSQCSLSDQVAALLSDVQVTSVRKRV